MMVISLLGAAIFLILSAFLPDPNVKRLCLVIGVVFAVVLLVLFLLGSLGYSDIRDPVLLR